LNSTVFVKTVHNVAKKRLCLFTRKSVRGIMATAMPQIANGQVGFSLSGNGRRFELGFAGEPPVMTGDRGLFDMMVALGNRHEWGIAPEEQTATVEKEGDALVARYGSLRHAGAEHDVRVALRFVLEGEGVVCEAEIENRSGLVIEEFWFPWLGPFRSLGPSRRTTRWSCRTGLAGG
jgi:hypothetical protein